MHLLSTGRVLDIHPGRHALGVLKQHVVQVQGDSNHLVRALHMEVYQCRSVLADGARLEPVVLHARLLPYLPPSRVDGRRRVQRDERLDLDHALDAVGVVVRRLLPGREVEDDRHVCGVDGQVAARYEWPVDDHFGVQAEGDRECGHEEGLHEHVGRECADEFEFRGSF